MAHTKLEELKQEPEMPLVKLVWSWSTLMMSTGLFVFLKSNILTQTWDLQLLYLLVLLAAKLTLDYE